MAYKRKTAWKKAPKTAFKKGHPKPTNSGRKKGTPNKITTDFKQAVINSLNTLGGEGYLVRQGRRNPRSYMPLLVKLMPVQVTGKDDGPIEVLIQKAQGGLSGLSDAELKALQSLIIKIGLS